MVKISDGGGKNGDAKVSSNQRLDTSARTAARTYYESRDNAKVYTVVSDDATAVANEETLYLQNTSTINDIVIDHITISTDTNARFRLKFVTGTAAGTVITPVNLNKTSSNAANINCRGNGSVTGLTDDGFIESVRILANDTYNMTMGEAVRLGQNDAIAIETLTNCAVEMDVEFHYDSE
jgi:hypothetical protein